MIRLESIGECYIKPGTLNARIRSLEMVPPENRFNPISPCEVVSHLEAVIADLDPVRLNLLTGKVKNYGDMLDMLKNIKKYLD